MSLMVVLWDSGWHEVRPDDEEERGFARANGGTIVRAAIDSERQADRICFRLDSALHRRQLEGEEA
jgi:hypothetical protein